MHLEGDSTVSGVLSVASVPSASGEIDSSGAIDFSVISGTFLSDKTLSLMNLSSKNAASRASMMEFVPRFKNLQASLSLAKQRTHTCLL